MKEIVDIEEYNSKNLYFKNVGTAIYSGRDTNTGDIISAPVPPKLPEKNKSWVDLLANPASIASFIITMAGVLLQFFSNFQYAVILVLIGILIFVLLVVTKLKQN